MVSDGSSTVCIYVSEVYSLAVTLTTEFIITSEFLLHQWIIDFIWSKIGSKDQPIEGSDIEH